MDESSQRNSETLNSAGPEAVLKAGQYFGENALLRDEPLGIARYLDRGARRGQAGPGGEAPACRNMKRHKQND